MKTYAPLWYYVAQLFLEWEIFHTNVVEKNKAHFMFNDTPTRRLCRLIDNVEKCGELQRSQMEI